MCETELPDVRDVCGGVADVRAGQPLHEPLGAAEARDTTTLATAAAPYKQQVCHTTAISVLTSSPARLFKGFAKEVSARYNRDPYRMLAQLDQTNDSVIVKLP